MNTTCMSKRGLMFAGFALTGLALAATTDAVAQAPSVGDTQTRAARNKALVEAAFDKWGAGTGGPFELLTDDATWEIVGSSVASRLYASKEDFMAEVIRPFNARLSVGLKPKIRSIVAEGDRVAIFFDAQGTARDGKLYVNTYAWFFDMKDDRVIKASAFFDPAAFNDLWSRVKPAP